MKKCPKCDTEMKKGTVVAPQYAKWKPGEPLTRFGGHVISGYRCPQCKFVELWTE